MTGALKKGVLVLALVFVGYYMFTDPGGLAQVAKDGAEAIWEAVTAMFGAVIDFIDQLRS